MSKIKKGVNNQRPEFSIRSVVCFGISIITLPLTITFKSYTNITNQVLDLLFFLILIAGCVIGIFALIEINVKQPTTKGQVLAIFGIIISIFLIFCRILGIWRAGSW